jgi:hypothetical protein
MLLVQGSITIGNVEGFLRSLSADPTANVLRIPTDLQEERAGGRSALIQFLFTWQAHLKNTKLITHIPRISEADIQLKNLSEEEHGLFALLLAENVCTAKGEAIDDEAFATARKRYAEIGSRIYLRGTRASVFVASHAGPAALSSPFEGLAVPQSRAERRTAFVRAINGAIVNCLAPSSAKTLLEEHRAALADILYELFANAEEWGSRNLDGAPLPRDVRGISMRGHSKEQLIRKALAEQAKGFPALERYLKSLEKDDFLETRPFLEVSVFDNGVGLAQQLLRKTYGAGMTIEEEYDAVQECLRRHVSSSQSPAKGVGLFFVMKLLHKVKGFLRVRTGRLSLYRDFTKDAYLLSEAKGSRSGPLFRHAEYLLDFKSEEYGRATEFPLVSGALFTFWIPLKNLDVQGGLFSQPQ